MSGHALRKDARARAERLVQAAVGGKRAPWR